MDKWPADEITRHKVADLVPYARNSRTHSDAQVAQIAASIKEWGWTTPVLIDPEGGIIAGHGRIMAAQKLGIEAVPCMVAEGWTDAQKKAYVLADNQLALNAGWDDDLLKIELQELEGLKFDLDLIGFDVEELADLLAPEATEGLTDEDAVPEPPEQPVTVEGDVWLLGRHRLMCGDSTSIDAVEKLMDGVNADLCFTSPPYAQQRDYKKEISDWDGLMNGVFSACPVKDGAQILVNLGLVHEKGKVNSYWDSWLVYMETCGWPLFGWYVWDKGFGMPGNWNGRLAPAHEFIFHFAKSPSQSNKWVAKDPKYIGERSGKKFRQKDGSTKAATSPEKSNQPTKVADSVIRVTPHMARNMDTTHPAMFPVALCEHIYNSYAKAGDWMFEPFSGSGTSIIACDKMGMNCAAMELAPEYTDIAIQRWQNFTGETATLESTGQTYDDLKAERCKPAA